MARTAQNVCDRARLILKDPAKTRFSDPELLLGVNDAITILRRRRPDLFFGSLGTAAIAEIAIGDNLPIEDQFFVPVCQYVTAWAEFREDEDTMIERAAEFYKLFDSGLKQ